LPEPRSPAGSSVHAIDRAGPAFSPTPMSMPQAHESAAVGPRTTALSPVRDRHMPYKIDSNAHSVHVKHRPDYSAMIRDRSGSLAESSPLFRRGCWVERARSASNVARPPPDGWAATSVPSTYPSVSKPAFGKLPGRTRRRTLRYDPRLPISFSSRCNRALL
jgi:hypothetical protein